PGAGDRPSPPGHRGSPWERSSRGDVGAVDGRAPKTEPAPERDPVHDVAGDLSGPPVAPVRPGGPVRGDAGCGAELAGGRRPDRLLRQPPRPARPPRWRSRLPRPPGT